MICRIKKVSLAHAYIEPSTLLSLFRQIGQETNLVLQELDLCGIRVRICSWYRVTQKFLCTLIRGKWSLLDPHVIAKFIPAYTYIQYQPRYWPEYLEYEDMIKAVTKIKKVNLAMFSMNNQFQNSLWRQIVEEDSLVLGKKYRMEQKNAPSPTLWKKFSCICRVIPLLSDKGGPPCRLRLVIYSKDAFYIKTAI